MPLSLDGKLTIPLYHGTNLLFYSSIRKHGLGGRDLIKELGVIDLLRELIGVCETSLPFQEDWILRMQCAKFIASQDVTDGGFNFRHGSTYLAASLEKAAGYAASSEFSSEALTQFMILWTRIEESGVDLPAALKATLKPVVDFALGTKIPLVFELNDVAISDLAAEDGGDPNELLGRVGALVSGDVAIDRHFLGAANFEAIRPLSIANARTFRIRREPTDDSYSSKGYSLVLFHGEANVDESPGEVIHKVGLA